MTNAPARLRPVNSRLHGSIAPRSRDTSLPRLSPKPPGSRKSRCMSMKMAAQRSNDVSNCAGVASNVSLAMGSPHRLGALVFDECDRLVPDGEGETPIVAGYRMPRPGRADDTRAAPVYAAFVALRALQNEDVLVPPMLVCRDRRAGAIP